MTAHFEVDVTFESAKLFAELFGDWNPLHTDPEHAARTPYKRPVLHGAFSAGLMSRMAGMHLPGKDCLLHGMRLRFIAPVMLPATLSVVGRQSRGGASGGTIDVEVSDATKGTLYVQGSYDFGLHESSAPTPDDRTAESVTEKPILVTGSSGGLGGAVMRRLGGRGVAVPRDGAGGGTSGATLEALIEGLPHSTIGGIVHCGWPRPDNVALTALLNPAQAVAYNLASPMVDMIHLAQALMRYGSPDSTLVLVGSTGAEPGRHNYRMPLYTIAKSTLPATVRALSIEFAVKRIRCIGLIFDVLDGGMNGQISQAMKVSHADRSPHGEIMPLEEAAGQIDFVLANRSIFMSGAMINLSGGAIP
jgi:3-hydroxybutyryl-CoA dehydratase